ncbi:MAG: heme A synthase [Granulosicoccus sp.]
MPTDLQERRFVWCAALTVATIFTLILVGGIVRASGAGMGCPDWPTCFGRWIPPTSESQLPADYQQIYADRGYADTVFNVRKTWTEYLNRLLGVVTGLAIFATLLCSLAYRRSISSVFLLSLAGFILVCVQGWLGSRVVASNLMPGMITVHMLLAQVIVGIMIAALINAVRHRYHARAMGALPGWIYPLMIVAMAAGLLQLVMGTQVREAVDLISRGENVPGRHLWVENLPLIFSIHKYFSIPLLAINVLLVISVLKHSGLVALRWLGVALMCFLMGTAAVGMGMERLNVPVFAQPLHLWFASLIFGTQLAMLLILLYSRSEKSALVPGMQSRLSPDYS